MRKERSADMVSIIGLCAAVVFLLLRPSEAVGAAYEGLIICGKSIIPSLFPFFALSSIAVNMGLARYPAKILGGVMEPLFRVPGAGAAALSLGLLGGYPTGARTVGEMYEKDQLGKNEAERLLGFCNNCSPAFIFGVAGASVFKNGRIGLFLYIIHVVSALLTGLVLGRFWKNGANNDRLAPVFRRKTFASSFAEGMKSAVSSTLAVCGYVIFFTLIVKMSGAGTVIAGFLEIATGTQMLTGATLPVGFTAASFILGWGGMSVHFQSMSFTGKLSVKYYFLGKALHGIAAAALAYAVLPLL